MTNQNFCSNSWSEINLHLSSRRKKHCCKATYEELPIGFSVEYINNSSGINTRRNDMAMNVRNAECNICWKSIDSSGKSFRDSKHIEEDYAKIVDSFESESYDPNEFVKELEIQFDNLCDQSCIYCSEIYSSKISAERGLKDYYNTYSDSDIETIVSWIESYFEKHPTNRLKIKFIGGEPTYSKGMYRFFELLISTKVINYAIDFYIITNNNFIEGVRYKLEYFMGLYPENVTFSFGVSGESLGRLTENIRYGVSFERWESNLKWLLSHPRVNHISFMMALSIFSVKDYPNFLKHVFELCEEYHTNSSKITFSGNWVVYPNPLSAARAPEFLKENLINCYATIEKHSDLLSSKAKSDLIKWVDRLSTVVGSEYNPEYPGLMEFLEKERVFKNGLLDIDLLMNQIKR
jgi:sulfatase maturation enzyme AslB (radical SAM superfamily)